MNKIYTDETSYDHEELGDGKKKIDMFVAIKTDFPFEEQLTALELVDSLRIHLRTASLLDSLFQKPMVH